MSRRATGASALAAIAMLSIVPVALCAQGVSVDVSAGRLVYDPTATNVDTNNLVGSVRYDGRRDTWVYGAAALPFSSSDTFWGSAGVGGRLQPPLARRVTFGADLAAHGYAFRDAVSDQLGNGGTVDALPFVRLTSGLAFVEGTGGWRGHTLSLAGVRDNRGVIEGGARAGYGGIVSAQGDVKWVHAPGGTYPFAGGTVSYNGARVQVWGQAGRWLSNVLDDAAWGTGAGVTLGPRTTMWASVQQEARDPLFWNTSRRTWSVGVTQRLSARPVALLPVPRVPAGGTVIRLDVADAPAGAISIGGDFNNWQPAPMQREGREWVMRLSLAPGVYHYAFRSANGEWFVPASTPGRRDDGFGGHDAILVVS